jgi:hypothetical protein
MSQNQFQDGVKLLIWMHQDEALVKTIETGYGWPNLESVW